MNTALHFSGGKDSLACLYLLRERWNDMLVCWVNSGASYPEVIHYMAAWRTRLPHFLEIKSNQPEQIRRRGYPSDVVPLRFTALGRDVFQEGGALIQSAQECCAENMWLPMQQAMREHGITRIVRGQRLSDRRSSPIRNGHVDADGVEYLFPIESWTRADVDAYLKEVGAEVPAYYGREQTSRDCWDCTAYLDENVARIQNLPLERRKLVNERLNFIGRAIAAELKPLVELGGAG